MPDTVREAQPPSRPARRDEAENAETQQERMGGRERREACAGRGQTTFLIWAAADHLPNMGCGSGASRALPLRNLRRG
eukprot:CAMPEP_0181180930 /NCGR_PEP_ID=MMETSP1096-20121128/7069_1 /TAXON_ID=156174 ORGANISM="Chrysochromulina ericina, Strain CCMP281" /NCGR_SAMPLE_ID=MMETSP1096 /ASSEMBLY_ACC=CAM_ASM_000453 /LENGTH=77 /DNA_ID=CAMNT_0023269405 /DNA_START=248 /DNA_END=479 /DNA_ORIENTATION=+